MGISDQLKMFRSQPAEKEPKEDESSATPRTINLTDEEVKSLGEFQAKPGEEIVLEVSGRLEGSHFHVMSAKYANGSGDVSEEDQKKIAGLDVGQMSQPSPS